MITETNKETTNIESINMLNTIETSRLLGVSRSTLALWRFKKTGPSYFKIGRKILYKKEDLLSLLKNSRVTII